MSHFNCTVWVPLTKEQCDNVYKIYDLLAELLPDRWFRFDYRHTKDSYGVRVTLKEN